VRHLIDRAIRIALGDRRVTVTRRAAQTEGLVHSLEFNLLALSGISLLVAGVLVATALATSVVQRRRTLALLVSLVADGSLKPHLVTNPSLPDAYVFHCMWQYRPWAADWAMSVPYEIYKTLGPGSYEVELVTEYSPGEMIVAHHEKTGRSDRTIVFHSNSCHPHMANDGFAGTALLIRLFQWLATQDTHYSYRLVIGPEHIGTVFYLRDHPPAQPQGQPPAHSSTPRPSPPDPSPPASPVAPAHPTPPSAQSSAADPSSSASAPCRPEGRSR